MTTHYAKSPDGIRIAYDVSGTGMPVILLHGGGQTRRHWHDAGYVNKLLPDFRVITMDIRGNGESDKPTTRASYTPEKHGQDILAVGDACKLDRFIVWGYSYGANIGRYLASQSARVSKFVMVGMPFGPGAPPDFRQFILKFRDHWEPILQAQKDGKLDIRDLSPEDQGMLQGTDVAVTVTWLTALLDWPSIAPSDLLCPTLWLVGSRNELAMAGVVAVESTIEESKIRLHVAEGLDHSQEFADIDALSGGAVVLRNVGALTTRWSRRASLVSILQE